MSDHNVMSFKANLPKKQLGKWCTISWRNYTPEAEAQFGEWVTRADWTSVMSAGTPSDKEEALSSLCQAALDKFMPFQSYRVKDTEKPWVSNGIRELFKKKKKLFRKQGFKSEEWKRLKRAVGSCLAAERSSFIKTRLIA